MSAPAAPAAPAAGSPTNQTRELAAQIYVEFVARAMLSGQNKPNPVDLAKYAYKLAEAFESIEADSKKEALAKMAKYDVKVDDMTNWKP